MSSNPTEDSIKPLVVGLTKTEALLDAGRDTIYNLIKARELDSFLEGKLRKVTVASIERLIQKRVATAGDEFHHGEHMRALRARPRRKSRRRVGAPA